MEDEWNSKSNHQEIGMTVKTFSLSPKSMVQIMNAGKDFTGNLPVHPTDPTILWPQLSDGCLKMPPSDEGGLFEFGFVREWSEIDHLSIVFENSVDWEIFLVNSTCIPGTPVEFPILSGTGEDVFLTTDDLPLIGPGKKIKIVSSGSTGTAIAEIVYTGISQS